MPPETMPVLDLEGPPALRLGRGELALVLLEDGAPAEALTEIACGLRPPPAGAARFLGEDWAALSEEEGDRRRARIGCVTIEGGWPPQLSVADAVILPALHHGQLAPAEATARAAELCRRFGLPGLPLGGPASLDDDALARAALARALVARPDLLILERPLREVAAPQPLAPLLDAIAAARHAACLWMTASPTLWGGRDVPAAARRFRLDAGGALHEVPPR